MSNVQHRCPPVRILGPSAVEAQDTRQRLFVGQCATTPAATVFIIRGASALEDALDAAAGDHGPAAGPNHRANESFIDATVADQSPVDPGLMEYMSALALNSRIIAI